MIQFTKDDHRYYMDGIPLPSVSSILRQIFGNKYEGIPEHILERARIFGTEVHELVELYNETDIERFTDDPLKNHCLSEWIRLKTENGIEVIASEQIVHFNDLYGGTFDGLGKIGDALVLLDYKVTYKLDKEHLLLQLNLYRMAYEWMTGAKISKLYGVWLRKRDRAELVELEILDDDEMIEMVKNALRDKANENLTESEAESLEA